MEPQPKESQLSLNNKLQSQIKFQPAHKLQSVLTNSEDQKIQRKVDLQLYFHFERLLGRNYYNYSKPSEYYKKKVSRQQIVYESIKYLNKFTDNIKPLPPQHNQQLLFLIGIRQNKLITNLYSINPYFKNSIPPTKFQLAFYGITTRIDLKQFFSLENWNHLLKFSFRICGWFNDDDWRALVENADNFKNLNFLSLSFNKISEIKEGDIEKFKSLKYINLKRNPLSGQSKEMLKKFRQKNNQIKIAYDI